MTRLSVIIPAYNAESTLYRAVHSIIKDEDIEIIIVENGSTDNTFELSKSMSKNDSRIKVIQSDKGVSCARNTGIKKSKGDWILFLDADDYFTDDAFIRISKYYNTDDDMVVFGHNNGDREVKVSDEDRTIENGDIEDARVTMIENPTRFMTAFSKLFKRDIIINNKLLFDMEMTISEDSDFVLRYLLLCNKISLSKECIYNYSIDNESTMRSYDKNRIKKYMSALIKTSKKIEEAPVAIKKAFGKYVLQNYNIMMVRGPFATNCPDTFVKKLSILRRTSKVSIVFESLKMLRLRDISNKRMLPVLLIKYKLYLLAAFIYSVRAYHNSRKQRGKR